MHVAITGASGLIGTALTRRLVDEGHRVTAVSRSPSGPDSIGWDPQRGRLDPADLAGVDAIVHLAGEPIAARRWTAAQKRRIRDSRTEGTGLVARTIAEMDDGPKVLVSSSAVGYYGERGDESLTEASGPGDDFLAGLCVAWEEAADPARRAGIRVAHPRTGLVQSPEGGALGKSLPLFKLGLGGRFGNGQQFWSWISMTDHVGILRHALLTDSVEGPVNATGPEPVTNAEYTAALAKVLGRPAALPVPKVGPGALLGMELAESLLFTSAKVLPKVAEHTGYTFAHADLESALRTELDR